MMATNIPSTADIIRYGQLQSIIGGHAAALSAGPPPPAPQGPTQRRSVADDPSTKLYQEYAGLMKKFYGWKR